MDNSRASRTDVSVVAKDAEKNVNVTKEEIRYAPVDGGWGWMCVAGGFLCVMFNAGMIIRAAGIMFVAVVDYFGSSATETSWINAVLLTMTFSMAPASTSLCSKIGARWTMITGGVLISVGFVSSSFVTSVTYLYFTISVLVGVGNSCCFVPMLMHVTLYFEKKKTLAFGLCMSGSGVGALFAGPLTAALLEEYSLPGTFLILGGIFLNIIVCGALMRPIEFYSPTSRKTSLYKEKKGQSVVKQSEGKDNLGVEIENEINRQSEQDTKDPSVHNTDFRTIAEPENKQISSSTQISHNVTTSNTAEDKTRHQVSSSIFNWRLLVKGETWLLCLCFTLGFMGYFNMASLLVPAHVDAIGLGQGDYTLLVSLMGGVDIIGRPLSGWILDLGVIPPAVFFCLSTSLAGMCVMLIPAAGTSIVGLAVLCALFGVFVSALPPLQPAVLGGRLGHEHIGTSMGINNFCMGLTYLIAQPLAGYIFDTLGSWHIAFYYSGGAMIVGSFIMASLTLYLNKSKSFKINTIREDIITNDVHNSRV